MTMIRRRVLSASMTTTLLVLLLSLGLSLPPAYASASSIRTQKQTNGEKETNKDLPGKRVSQIIVLMLENRSFDHMLGYLEMEGLDGVPEGQRCPIDPLDPSLGSLPITSQSYDISPDDPLHDYQSIKLQINGGKMDGFLRTQLMHRGEDGHPNNLTNPVSMFRHETAPIIHTLAQEYAVFDEWFVSVPSPTDPNRQYAMSGTSMGTVENFNGTLFPQQTYIDFLNSQDGHSAGGYYQNDLWMLGSFDDLVNKRSNARKIKELDEHFYDDLERGDLPEFTWLQPSITVNEDGRIPTWQHPDASVMEGERLLKKVYEAIRKSPKWNETLFILTYDEHGGFYDHVPPPQNVPNPDDIPCFSCGGDGYNFDTLGIRVPTIAISPWISKGTVVKTKDGILPAENSAFESTSILATVNELLQIPDHIPPLGKRMGWAAKFTNLIHDSEGLRKDSECIETLPELPPPPQPYSEEIRAHREKDINEHLFSSMLLFCGQNYPHEFEEGVLCPAAKGAGADRNQGSASDWLMLEQKAYFQKRERLWDLEEMKQAVA